MSDYRAIIKKIINETERVAENPILTTEEKNAVLRKQLTEDLILVLEACMNNDGIISLSEITQIKKTALDIMHKIGDKSSKKIIHENYALYQSYSNLYHVVKAYDRQDKVVYSGLLPLYKESDHYKVYNDDHSYSFEDLTANIWDKHEAFKQIPQLLSISKQAKRIINCNVVYNKAGDMDHSHSGFFFTTPSYRFSGRNYVDIHVYIPPRYQDIHHYLNVDTVLKDGFKWVNRFPRTKHYTKKSYTVLPIENPLPEINENLTIKTLYPNKTYKATLTQKNASPLPVYECMKTTKEAVYFMIPPLKRHDIKKGKNVFMSRIKYDFLDFQNWMAQSLQSNGDDYELTMRMIVHHLNYDKKMKKLEILGKPSLFADQAIANEDKKYDFTVDKASFFGTRG